MNELVEEWVNKAEGNYKSALALAKNRKLKVFDVICNQCQQCAEKYLTAILVRHQVAFPKTQDIKQLYALVSNVEPDLRLLEEADIQRKLESDERHWRQKLLNGKGQLKNGNACIIVIETTSFSTLEMAATRHQVKQRNFAIARHLQQKKSIRGKYYRAYRQGHTVRVSQDDGTLTEQHFTLQDGAVLLEPDVRRYFPDSESVNTALRSLIALIPTKPRKSHARKS